MAFSVLLHLLEVPWVGLQCVIVESSCHTHYRLKTFCGLFLGSNQYWAWERMVCVDYVTGAPEGSTESGS